MTIPKVYFNALQMQEEVTVELVDDGLLIKPVHKVPDDFEEQLLGSLIEKVFSGQELLEKFKEATNNTRRTTFHAVNDDDTIYIEETHTKLDVMIWKPFILEFQ